MKKLFLFMIICAFCLNLFAQEETEKQVDKPVRFPFESGYLIDNQTSVIPVKNTLEFVIQHKFGTTKNGITDLFGIYGPGANIRLGLNYVVLKNVQVGIGTTKNKKYTDLNAKWTILEQTRKNTVPFALTLYGMMAIDGRNKDRFGTGYVVDKDDPLTESEISFSDRYSYFTQLIIGRKFTDWFSLQVAASYSHYNMVKEGYDHDKIGAHINGRIKFSPQTSLIITYDVPLKIDGLSDQPDWENHPNSNLAFGVEMSTSTHAFQIYLGTADGIIPQDVMVWNSKSIKDNGFAIGFNITRLWSF